MAIAPYKTPRFLSWIFPKRVWAFSRKTSKVYLTFDDGPIPEVTPWVLQELDKFHAKATFFCIGDNVCKHPIIFNQIIKKGHRIGNHTQHHINGWKTSFEDYISDIALCDSALTTHQSPITNLFRPPYGRITTKQSKKLQQLGYQIIMWDVLTKDYDANISAKDALHNTIRAIRPGSIIVFHDSLKAQKKLKFILPKVLEYIKRNDWECCTI